MTAQTDQSRTDGARELTLRLDDFHAEDLGAVQAIDMLDHPFEDDVAVEVAYDLMDMRDDSAVGESFESLWLDDRVNYIPLARPVFADAFVAADSAAFHAVRPIHIGMHEKQQKIKIALVERVISRLE
jgi:hypothetical protein